MPQCIVCDKPLGADTQSEGYLTCHAHRTCLKCGLPLTALDIKLSHNLYLEKLKHAESNHEAFDGGLELMHSRCYSGFSTISDPNQSIKQSELDILNACRLMIYPDMHLAKSTNESNAMIYGQKLISQMSNDEIYAHIGMMEACIAQASLLVHSNKDELKKRADKREADKFKTAKQQAQTSSRPSGTKADDSGEVELATFMENFGIKSRKVALKLQRDRDKAVEGLVKLLHIPSLLAKQTADESLLKNIKQGKVKVEES